MPLNKWFTNFLYKEYHVEKAKFSKYQHYETSAQACFHNKQTGQTNPGWRLHIKMFLGVSAENITTCSLGTSFFFPIIQVWHDLNKNFLSVLHVMVDNFV